jgi:hypothetical protein
MQTTQRCSWIATREGIGLGSAERHLALGPGGSGKGQDALTLGSVRAFSFVGASGPGPRVALSGFCPGKQSNIVSLQRWFSRPKVTVR